MSPPEPAENDIASFISASIPSVWALETLLLLKRIAPQKRSLSQIVSELRSSELAVTQGLKRLHQAGLILSTDEEYAYNPAAPALAGMADVVEHAYATRPVWVVQIIPSTGNESLNIFADSFRLKD